MLRQLIVVCVFLSQPKKRPWSSPFIQHEHENKNHAIVCNFFAQGWCIKGSSCRFLHKKEVVGNSSLEAQEGKSTAGNSIDCRCMSK